MRNSISDSDKRQVFSASDLFAAFVKECEVRDLEKKCNPAFCESLPRVNLMDDMVINASNGVAAEIVAADVFIKCASAQRCSGIAI